MERIKRALAEARQRREEIAERSHFDGGGLAFEHQYRHVRADDGETQPRRRLKLWPTLATAALLIAAASWAIMYNNLQPRVGLNALEDGTHRSDNVASLMHPEIAATDTLSERVEALAARVDLLDASITRLWELQERINGISTSTVETPTAMDEPAQALAGSSGSGGDIARFLASPPARQPAASTSTDTGPVTVATIPHVDLPEDKAAPATEPTTVTASRPWVINLISFNDARSATRFATRAEANGVHVEQNQVTIKGKEYWRVRVPGFNSAQEATEQSKSIKAVLGLQEIWIGKN